MRTDQLVAALVADRRAPAAPPGRLLAGALAAGAVLSLAIFAVEFGPRVDLVAALATWRFDLKLLLVGLAFVAAF
ncbi:MAG: NrsF family protein, partial [Pseudomonadota bacterium]